MSIHTMNKLILSNGSEIDIQPEYKSMIGKIKNIFDNNKPVDILSVNFGLLFYSGMYYHMNSDYAKALEYYSRVDRGESLYYASLCYQEIGDLEKCLQCLSDACAKKNVNAMNRLGDYYTNTGDRDNAIIWYQNAINNNSFEHAFEVAEYYYDIGRTDEAEEYCKKAILNGSADAFRNKEKYGIVLKSDEYIMYLEKNGDSGDYSSYCKLVEMFKDTDLTRAQKYNTKLIEKGYQLYNI